MALSVCIPLTEGYEWPADDPPPVVICQNTWFSVLLTAISILAMIFYVYRLCKSQTFCKGHILGKTMTFYLVICQETRYCPIKLRVMAGHLTKLEMRNCLLSNQVKLDKNWIWDQLNVYWGNVQISYNGNEITMPQKLLIPLIDKIRMRYLFGYDFDAIIMVKQGRHWFNLENQRITDEPDNLLNA